MLPKPSLRTLARWGVACCLVALLAPGTASAAAEGPDDDFPYELHVVWDSLLGATAVLGLTGTTIAEEYAGEVGAAEVRGLDAGDVNALDRAAIGNWSPGAARASDVTEVVAAALPAILVIEIAATPNWRRAGIVAVMLTEATVLNLTLTSVVKVAAGRYRPYLYDSDLPMETRLGNPGDAGRSFYSGHTSVSFCGAVFFATVFADLHPRSAWRHAVWPLSLGLAAATGALRVAAGKHFPTDVLVGAAAGGLVGWAVPALHRRPEPGAPAAALLPFSAGGPGFSAVIAF
ncbi:MAG TPA: phosphatase PAP2 family protein [Polyangia bacterium]|nr:phosphatase PAP2 family protein [Polyangia bacterium]